MERLAGTPELLDGELDPGTLAGNLRDLARVNRRLGGADLSWRAVRWVAREAGRGQSMTLLDAGTGAADIPVELLRRAGRSGLPLDVTATDVRPEIVEFARARTRGTPNLRVALASDGRVPAGEFDIVHASLVLHHLDPEAAIEWLRAMAGVAGRAVVINDLDRARRWWLAAWLMTRVGTRNRYTRNDAPLSVRRAYRASEVAHMAQAAGLRVAARFDAPLGHRYALVLRPMADE